MSGPSRDISTFGNPRNFRQQGTLTTGFQCGRLASVVPPLLRSSLFRGRGIMLPDSSIDETHRACSDGVPTSSSKNELAMSYTRDCVGGCPPDPLENRRNNDALLGTVDTLRAVSCMLSARSGNLS